MIGRRRGKEHTPDPAPKDRSAVTKAELEAFIDQSRWLIEYHDKRGDSFTTRATALLGFSGVILVLLLRGPLPKVSNSPRRSRSRAPQPSSFC